MSFWANEGITVADIVGVGENGTGSNLDLYVVHRHGITLTRERGIFNKRITVERQCPLASIERLRTTQEGFKGTELTITGYDGKGAEVLKIKWGLGGPDWVEPLVLRQREHLFKVISAAMDSISEVPVVPPASSTSSKSAALTAWATDVVKAAEVGVREDLVAEHANMVAAGIRFTVFLRLGAERGIDDLSQFYPDHTLPPGSPIDTFDDLYEHVVARVGNRQVVDRAIDEQLAGSWREFVNGCREQYS